MATTRKPATAATPPRRSTERHSRKPGNVLAEAIELARYEPVTFARDILQLKRLKGEPKPGDEDYNADADWELDDWLIELLEAMADVARHKTGRPTKVNHEAKCLITLRGCRGPGKTLGLAVCAHVFGFGYDPSVIAVLAPKLEHIKTRFMGEFSKIAYRAIAGYLTVMKIGVTNVEWLSGEPVNHLLVAETAKQPENIQGLRRRFTLYLVDESSGVDDRLWEVADGNLSATEIGIRIQVGNPTRNTGTFARSHLSAAVAADYYRMHVKPGDSRRVKLKWIERMIRAYGERSPAVQVHCYGEFASADLNQLIAIEWCARSRMIEWDEIKGDGSLPRNRIAIDCAAGGDAETVCGAMAHHESMRVLKKITRHSFPLETATIDTADAGEKLFAELGFRKGEDDFVVDTNGVGAGVGGELYARGHQVVFYMGGSSSDDIHQWRNRRTQSYINLRNELRDGTLVMLSTAVDDNREWDEVDAQLCCIRTQPGTERVEDIEPKINLQRRGVKSPDIADMLCMQFATQVPKAMTDKIARAHVETVGERLSELLITNSKINDGLEVPDRAW